MRRSQIDRPDAGAKTGPSARATIAILDFGSQYTQLIARRVRESRVYCEIFPHDITPAELRAKNVIGVILSGGPASVYDEGAPSVDPRVISGDFPVLGICYGMQLMAHLLGGDVVAEGKREYGPATVEIRDHAGIFEGLSPQERAWVSHGDTVRRPPAGFTVVASTTSVPVAATFGPRLRLIQLDAADRFLAKLKDVTDPERKRAIIGEEFVRCFEEQAKRVGHVDLLVQGTIYPDVIESRSRESKTSARIKTHHNVGGLPDVMDLEVVEPLRRLFKDEVRRVGAELGIPEDILWRHPFPGPGLAVIVIGPVDQEKLDTLR